MLIVNVNFVDQQNPIFVVINLRCPSHLSIKNGFRGTLDAPSFLETTT